MDDEVTSEMVAAAKCVDIEYPVVIDLLCGGVVVQEAYGEKGIRYGSRVEYEGGVRINEGFKDRCWGSLGLHAVQEDN